MNGTTGPATKGQRTRDAILTQAVAATVRVGLGGLTLGDLATGTGMSKSGLYAHFGSKEQLQLAVLDAAAEEFAATVVRPALRAPRGEARIRDLADRWLACGVDRAPGGCVIVKAGTELDDQPGPVRDRLRELHLELARTIARIVTGGITEGQLRPDVDPEQFAFDLYGVMLAFFHTHRLLDDPHAPARAHRAVDALLAAARTPTHPTSETTR
ncbi:TetR/AcrR family transcriptional regulator [Cellulomonas soli]|uniref:TetR/AcrR family transcriptional regulator n=1 Tax=Cellulomonas soli TaxID=931535 RepID=UPI003F84797B